MKPRLTRVRYVGLAAAMLLCGTAAAIEPDLKNCTLQVGKEVLKPTAVFAPWKMAMSVGNRRFLVDKNAIVKPKQDRDAGWTVKSADGRHLYWLAADGDIAYLLGYQVDKDGEFTDYDSPPRLRRLDLKAGAWLPDLPLTAGAGTGRSPKAVVSLLAEGGKVVVITSLLKARRGKGEQEAIDAYEVRCFKSGAAKPLWSKIFPAVGERPYTGGWLWGVPPPQYAASEIQHLTWLDDRLLVCAEAMQPILCLNGDTGSEIWRLERPWEFQRGFIGPSVWSHYIGRFGIEDSDAKGTKIDDARKAFDSRWQCALVAGPVAVPLGGGGYRIFLAVARSPAEPWAGYLSDCIVYEFDDGGEPVSMAMLPQMVEGASHSVCKGGVVWKCQNETFVKIAATNVPMFRMGPGGSDLIARVAWLRQLSYAQPAAWFAAGRAGDSVAIDAAHVFCVPAGGYIVRKHDPVYRFPIAAIDLSTGLDTDLLFNVPFKGKIRIPETNYSFSTLADGSRAYQTSLPCEAAVTGLHLDGGQIEIVLGLEKRAASVRFDLSKVLGRDSAASQEPSADELMKAARARARAIDRKNLNEALLSAADGDDVAFLKALLEAGADPKYVAKGVNVEFRKFLIEAGFDPKQASQDGFTALMGAASDGTAVMVDVLIRAGSNVNASKKNYGETVLMWAAESARQSKRKVQLLLKAGADRDATSADGRNALMAAAQHGDLPTVEFLLQAGMKPSHRNKEGETVLMAACGSCHANVVKVLIEAGADVNAVDKKGRTALQIAEASNDVGSDRVVELLKAAARK